MPRCNGSLIGVDAAPTASSASGIWTVREAERYLRAGQWPAQPVVPDPPSGTAGDQSVELTWNAVSSALPVTDYIVEYSSNAGADWVAFDDGVSSGTSATVTGLTNGTGYIFRIIAVNALGNGPSGSASQTFTPEAPIPTSLLLHLDGSNGSTTFTDSAPRGLSVSRNGSAVISTAQSKFGGASAYFASQNDYLTVASHAAFGFGVGDFAIEFWARLTSQAGNNSFISIGTYQDGILFREAGGSNDPLYIGGTAYQWNSGRSAMTTGQWYHVALTRDAGTVRVFVGGDKKFEAANSANLGSERSVTIAMASHSAGGQYAADDKYLGYIDELRITKGLPVYTSNFTPPSAPF